MARRRHHRVLSFSVYLLTHLTRPPSPLIGGTFSSPAIKFPILFDNQFFNLYPYFLPGFISAVISFAGVAFGYFFLEEVRQPSYPMQPIAPLLINIL